MRPSEQFVSPSFAAGPIQQHHKHSHLEVGEELRRLRVLIGVHGRLQLGCELSSRDEA